MTDSIDYGQVLAVIDANPDRAAALQAFVDQEREHAAYVADRAVRLELHRCHTAESASPFAHALVCPTGVHVGGWQHMGGPHKMCKECG